MSAISSTSHLLNNILESHVKENDTALPLAFINTNIQNMAKDHLADSLIEGVKQQ